MGDTFWYVYLLRCADDSLYCGVTTNIERRISMHNGILKGGAKYTRTRRPVSLELAVKTPDRSSACKLEYATKKCPTAKKITFLQEYIPQNPQNSETKNFEGQNSKP